MNNKIAIIFCVEKGILEHQAKMLVNSYQKFAMSSDIQLIAVSPRKGCLPSTSTISFLINNNVLHINENLNIKYQYYPIANKVLACSFIEKNYPEFNSLMFVDTDTVFLNPIKSNVPSINKKSLKLRPVNNKGPGTLGSNDSNDLFWRKVYKLCNVTIPPADLTTTVRQKVIRPYYNAGFIWSENIPKFFQQWETDFTKIMKSNLRPFKYSANDKTNFRCIDQVALAVTAQRFKSHIELLDIKYNYPIIFRPIIKNRFRHPDFNELVLIHYHKWFQHRDFLDHVTSHNEKKSQQYLWLKDQLPLLPEITGEFKC